jgi:hypothetical protein
MVLAVGGSQPIGATPLKAEEQLEKEVKALPHKAIPLDAQEDNHYCKNKWRDELPMVRTQTILTSGELRPCETRLDC